MEEGVLSLSSYSFCEYTELQSVTLAESVTKIGNSALRNCTSLTNIELSSELNQIDVAAFEGCTKLVKIVLPKNLTSIEKYAFYNCVSLQKMEIPDGVMTIGEYTFYGCSSLVEITMPKVLTSIWEYAFYGCSSLKEITLPDEITTIEGSTFEGCTSLTTVAFSKELTTIGSRAFEGCSNLKELTFPSKLTKIDTRAFCGCTGITSIYVPKSLTDIRYSFELEEGSCTVTYEGTKENWLAVNGYYIYKNEVTCKDGVVKGSGETAFVVDATDTQHWMLDSTGVLTIVGEGKLGQYQKAPWFKYRDMITEVRIGEGVTKIEHYEFTYYRSLKKISLPSTLTSMDDYIFKGCSSLERIVIPDGVTSIGKEAFLGCSKLTEITLPLGITGIPDGMFTDCSSLGEVTLPENVTTIGESAFKGCSALGEITLPKNVTTIGGSAFKGCSALGGITLPESITSIGAQAFSQCTDMATVIMPENITKLEESTFADCSKLENILLPQELITIGPKVFENCINLKRLDFSAALRRIDTTAFTGCTGITNVFYAGTNDMWNEIGYRFNVEVTCSDGQKVAEGTCGEGLTWTLYTLENYGRLIITGSGAMEDYNEKDPAPWSNDIITQVYLGEEITNIGASAFEGCTQLQRITLPESLQSINKYAFYNCMSLEEIEVPVGVTSIETSAFEGCTALRKATVYEKTVSIKSSAFDRCEALTLYGYGRTAISEYAERKTIPFVNLGYIGTCGDEVNWFLKDGILTITGKGKMSDYSVSSPAPWQDLSVTSCTVNAGVTSIGEYAFKDCIDLVSITLTEDIRYMGSHSFENCSKLPQITIPANVNIIDEAVFKECTSLQKVQLPEQLLSIGEEAFYHCTGLTNVDLPEQLDTIGAYAFARCTGLTEFAMPVNLWSISEGVLANCERLETVILGEQVHLIQSNAFANTKITTVTIPKTTTEIAADAWNGCTKLTEYIVEEGNTTYQSYEGILYTLNGTNVLSCPMGKAGSCKLLRKTTTIGENAFKDCTLISSIVLPNEVTTIGARAFENTALTTVSIPASVTLLPISAFANCDKLESIVVDADNENYGSVNGMLTNKDKTSIWYCPIGMKNVTVPEGVTSITEEAFKYCQPDTYIDMPFSLENIPEVNVFEEHVVLMVYTNSDAYDYALEHEYSYQSKGNYLVAWDGSEAHHIKRGYKKLVARLEKEINNTYTHTITDTKSLQISFSMTYTGSAIKCTYRMRVEPAAAVSTIETTSFLLDKTGVVNNTYYFSHVVPVDSSYNQDAVAVIPSTSIKSTDGGDAYSFTGLYDATLRENASQAVKISITELYLYLVREQMQMKDLGYSNYLPTDSIHTSVSVGAKKPTCTEDGYSGDYYCAICGALHEKGQSIPATGHNEVIDEAEEPTCTENGRTKGSHCSICHEVIKESQSIPATGHNEVIDEAEEPICTENGRTKGSHCSICHEVIKESQSIPATGHNYVTSVKKATLTANGKVEKCCSQCGEVESSSTIYYPKTITLSSTSYLYKGRAQKPTVKVVDSHGAVVSASNYTVTYPSGCSNPGTYSVKITFKNYYSGTACRSYKIGLAKTSTTLTNASSGISVRWTKVAGAKGYYIYRKTGSGAYSKIKTIASGTTISYNDATVKNNNGKLYTYAVVPYAGSVKASYLGVSCYRLTTPAATSLKNSSKGKLAVAWKKAKYVNGYELQYATTSSFSSGKVTVKINSPSILARTISSLKKNKTYYVRIRTFKKYSNGKKDYSGWSSTKKLKIKK